MTYEVHDDGEMWSAALWRLRGMLGKDVVDRLAVVTGYFVWSSASFRDAVNAMVQADRVYYGGAHESTIRQVFRENGMLAYWIWTESYPWWPWPWSDPLVDNNGFEAGAFAPVWGVEASDPSVTPQIVTSPVYAGTYAAGLVGSSGGSATESAIYYEFTMPSDATWVRMRFHYRIDTADSWWYDWFEWRLGTAYSYWGWSTLWDTGGEFYEFQADLPVAGLGMAGQTCRLTFLLHDDGFPADPTYVYLDGTGGTSWRDDISLRYSNFHAPITINGETQDTPWQFGKRIPDGTPVYVSAPSQVDIGGLPYHFMQWSESDGGVELDSTHPPFTPTDDLYLEANYHGGWTVPFTSYWLKSPVTLDGQVSSPTEWSDAVPQDLTLPEFGNGPAAVSAKCWMKNDATWLYILERVTWSGPTSPHSDGDISYYWDWWNGVWPHSDLGGVNFDGTTFDVYGWDETTWYNDPVNNVQGAATYDGTYYWFEFSKLLDSGDGHDWTFVPGETYGPNPPSLMVGFYDESTDTWYGTNILLYLEPELLGLSNGLANLQDFTASSPGSTLMTIGDLSESPHGSKPPGVNYQIGRDMTPLGYIRGMLVNTQPSMFDTNAIIDANGRPTGDWPIIFTIGGPGINAVSHYYETTSTTADRAPITFSFSGSNYVWTDQNGNVVETVARSSCSVPPGTSDVFVIQILRDADGRLVAMIYGTHYTGTWAGAEYFKFIVYPDIATYTNSYYIVRWTDATSGTSANMTPDSGDTFAILAQG
jgi:hypothetical protein